MSLAVTIHKRPDGRTETILCSAIYLEDEQWFKRHNATVSLEELPVGGYAAYADIGLRSDEGEPLEAIEVSGVRDCAQTLQALRRQCERMLAEHKGARHG